MSHEKLNKMQTVLHTLESLLIPASSVVMQEWQVVKKSKHIFFRTLVQTLQGGFCKTGLTELALGSVSLKSLMQSAWFPLISSSSMTIINSNM